MARGTVRVRYGTKEQPFNKADSDVAEWTYGILAEKLMSIFPNLDIPSNVRIRRDGNGDVDADDVVGERDGDESIDFVVPAGEKGTQ